MEKDFPPYAEALEMKHLDFDEPCFGKFLTSLQSNWKDYELILELGMNDTFEDNRNIYLLEKACSAPTFSQAFRWFREEHQLPSWVYTSNNQEYWYSVLKDGRMIVRDYKPFKSYEEAELACLRKLIQIVKEKQ